MANAVCNALNPPGEAQRAGLSGAGVGPGSFGVCTGFEVLGRAPGLGQTLELIING